MTTGKNTIHPTASEAVLRELTERLIGTRARDRAELEQIHRELLAADPEFHRRALAWLAARDPEGAHLTVGLAVRAVAPDAEGRRFVARMIERLPLRAVAAVVDYVHGWKVDRTHVFHARARYADAMTGAYVATAGEVNERLAEEHDLSDLSGGEILVTTGQYDRVQQVLDYLELPYKVLSCRMLAMLSLRADQVVIVNCPGRFTGDGIEKLRRFVAAGGTLITTDWALKTTIERAFPGTVEYNGTSTADDVVSVSWIDPDNVYTRGVDVPGQTLQWWLEGSSYPIRIVDRRVRVLVRSDEMATKYRDDPLVVVFDYGEGRVFHLTSHYYLQRTKADATGDDAEATKNAAAYSSLKLLGNILLERRRACGA